MKAHVSALFILGACFFYSCQKNFEGAGNNIFANAPPGFSANINGEPFVASIYGASIRSDGVISMAAKSDDNKTLVFSVRDSGAHLYTLDINSRVNVAGFIDVAGIAFTSNGGSNSAESGGTLTIAFIDTVRRVISGTFSFKGYRQTDMKQKIITGGIFKNISF